MRYVIKCEGREIAKFTNESDRDICLAALRGAYEDVDFEAEHSAGGDDD